MSNYSLFTPVQFGGETTYGTTAASFAAVGSIQNISESNANNFKHIRSNSRNIQKSVYGKYVPGLSGSFQVHDFDFLKHFVGPKTGNGAAQGTAYTITQAELTSLSTSSGIQAFSMEVGDSVNDEKTTYVGCQGVDFTLSGSVNSILDCSFNVMAQKPTDSSTATSYTEPTTKPWVFSQSVVKFGSTPSTTGLLESFSISVANVINPRYGAGAGRFTLQPVVNGIDIKFNLNMYMNSDEAQDLIDAFYGQANSPTTCASDAEDVLTNEFKIELSEGSGAGLRNADIWLDEVHIDNISKDTSIGGDNIVMLTVNGIANKFKDNKAIVWWTGTRS